MDDSLNSLLKNGTDAIPHPKKTSKKLSETRKWLSKICRSLMVDSQAYLPEKTVSTVEEYLQIETKLDRILYSEISAFIISLNEKDRGTFSTNIDKLLLHVLDDSNNISNDSRKICIKVYDHFQLNLTQIESANNTSQNAMIRSIEKAKVDLHSEVRSIEKEYITILGIFAAIMLAFVGSFTFSTSVLNNISSINVYKLAVIALIIGLIFVTLITVLIDFLREINGVLDKDKYGYHKMSPVSQIAIIVLCVVITIVLIGQSIAQS